MVSPLVTRPPYMYGRPAMPVGESKLPSGGPGGKGMPIDPGLPGTKTFAKPEDDIRQPQTDDEPIKRIDGPDDLLKDRSKIDTREDNAPKHDGIGYSDSGPFDTPKTKYPYRDDKPNAHNASTDFVLERFLAENAHDLLIDLEGTPPRVAATIIQISQGLNPKVQERAKACAPKLKRADLTNLRWIFTVDCGNGPKVVTIKASRKHAKTTTFTKMDVLFSCSCPAWQWLGPEHNAQQGGYLDRTPRGTASPPDIKDPERHNRVCKHVAAVVELAKQWVIPVRKKAPPKIK